MAAKTVTEMSFTTRVTADDEFLPYHRFGLGKYEMLGEVYQLDDDKTPSNDLVEQLQDIIDEAFGR